MGDFWVLFFWGGVGVPKTSEKLMKTYKKTHEGVDLLVGSFSLSLSLSFFLKIFAGVNLKSFFFLGGG